MDGKGFIVVSNRLPIELKYENEQIAIHSGSGGLVTALAPVLKNRGGIWIGWPGGAIEDEAKVQSLLDSQTAHSGYKFCPVFLTKKEVELYYQGFANHLLWPLFHDLLGKCEFSPAYWEGYKNVNSKFADVIAQQATSTDFVWIHDYQLMLLGEELSQRNPALHVGFFLHIPFPPLDIFAKLPWRTQILKALLKYDLIGFQTHRDRRNFINCLRALEPEINIVSKKNLHICKVGDKEIRVGAFPICIDYNSFKKRSNTRETKKIARSLRDKWIDQRLILSIDRLDYTKGILLRLEAIRTFLKNYPKYHKKVTFLQFILPSRVDVPEYQQLKRDIDQLVGEINSQFSKESWTPICYFYRFLDQSELLAYYRISEVALITPIKDGMNLVAKEYLACNRERNGVLILSEFAGAAAQLQQGAILINPYDIIGIAKALDEALKMPLEERKQRMQMMQRNVKRYDIFWWTRMYLNAAFGLELSDLPIDEEPLQKTT